MEIDINYLARVFAVNAELEALKTEREAMIALNQYRLSRDETIGYDENSFVDLANRIWGVSNELQSFWRS